MGTNERKRRTNKRQVVLLVLLFLAIPFFIRWYYFRTSDLALLRVRFETAGKLSETFKLEIASTEGERKHGLMYRKSMSPEQGMLFVFPKEEDHSFWMRDTYLSLDMIFIDSEFKVVGVLADVPILNETSRKVGAPSLYVVELLAGSAKKNAITAGSILKPEGPIPRGV